MLSVGLDVAQNRCVLVYDTLCHLEILVVNPFGLLLLPQEIEAAFDHERLAILRLLCHQFNQSFLLLMASCGVRKGQLDAHERAGERSIDRLWVRNARSFFLDCIELPLERYVLLVELADVFSHSELAMVLSLFL